MLLMAKIVDLVKISVQFQQSHFRDGVPGVRDGVPGVRNPGKLDF